jgi:glyoxylase-like metal-dependent hydrolase (beta-lactamase superfamily II)
METTNSPAAVKQNDSVHRTSTGNIVVTSVSDGFMRGGDRIIRGIEQGLVAATLSAANRFPANVEVNAFVIAHAGRMMLIDTGSGHYMGRNAGHLADNLCAGGINSDEIDTVLLSHIHPDHVGGLTNKDGIARYPNAELLVDANEYAFWMEGGAESWVQSDQRSLFVDCPREQITPYLDRLRLISDGDEVFPGVTSLRFPGHTPGHSIFAVNSEKEKLLIWGDTVHVPEVQTAFPEAGVIFDVDAPRAAASRRRVFELAVSEQLPILGMHTRRNLMHLERDGTAFRIAPQGR